MIVPNPFFIDRGFAVKVLEEIRELRKIGHDITVCTYHCGYDLADTNIERIINIPWYSEEVIGASYHRLYLDTLLMIKGYNLCKKTNPDIIHGYIHEGGLISEILSKVTGIPALVDIQGSLTYELEEKRFIKQNTMLYQCFNFLEKKIYDWAALIVTQSTDMKKDMIERYKIQPEKIVTAMDGVNTEDFRPNIDTKKLTDKLGIPKNKSIIVYLGLLTSYQGIDILIQSADILIKRTKDIHFLIMGYPNTEKYKETVTDLNIAEYFTFTGRIDYKMAPEYLCLGDIAISPKVSQTEGNGKLYNYIACGLPTVVFDTKVNREILGDLGYYAEYKNPISFAMTIENALKDKNRKRIGSELRLKAIQNFSWGKVAERIDNCYQKLASNVIP
jgi:glycosyltransferase involved in cell wall biosynthesis